MPAIPSHPPPTNRRRRVLIAVALLASAAAGWAGYARVSPEWRADRELDAARTAAADSDYGLAREHLQVLLRLRPKSAWGHFLMARASRQSDDFATARLHLAQAKAVGWLREDLDIEEHLIEAQEVGPRGENEKVLQALVAARHPAEREILEGLVKGYRNAGLLVAAMGALATWIERFPDDWLPHQWRGETFRQINLPDDARADFLRVLELRSRNRDALRGLGQLELDDKRDVGAARGHFAALLEVAPDDPAGLLGMAVCLRSLGDPGGARGVLDRLLAREPGHARGCLEYAVIEADAGRPAEALGWAKRAEAALPDESEPHYRLGGLFNRLGQPESAAPHVARAELLGETYRKTGEWARQLLTDPSRTDLRYQIGAELLRAGRDQTAVAWLSSALLEQPDHKPSHLALASYYRKIGDARRAAEHERLGGAVK